MNLWEKAPLGWAGNNELDSPLPAFAGLIKLSKGLVGVIEKWLDWCVNWW